MAIKIGEVFTFEMREEMVKFKVKELIKEKGSKIYRLEAIEGDSKGEILYKSLEQLEAYKTFEKAKKMMLTEAEIKREILRKEIKKAITSELKKDATVEEIAFWIWRRGWHAAKEEPEKYIHDERFGKHVDCICFSSDVYDTCIDYFISLKELKDWHELCRLADDSRSPLKPKIQSLYIYVNKEGYLYTENIVLEETEITIENILNKLKNKTELSINKEDIIMTTRYIARTSQYEIINL